MNNAVQKTVQFVHDTSNTATGIVRSVVFVPTHNIFDYAELKLESVMLKKSKGAQISIYLQKTQKTIWLLNLYFSQ